MKALLGPLLLILTHANIAANDIDQAISGGNLPSIKIVTIKPSSPPYTAPATPLEGFDAKPLALSQVETGSFPCKHGDLLSVRNDATQEANQFVISVASLKKSYQMQRVQSVSGAVRLEDVYGGIVLLQLANKTMLLDLKRGNTLATDCQSATQRLFAEEMNNNPNRQSILD